MHRNAAAPPSLKRTDISSCVWSTTSTRLRVVRGSTLASGSGAALYLLRRRSRNAAMMSFATASSDSRNDWSPLRIHSRRDGCELS